MWIRVVYQDLSGAELGYTAWITTTAEVWMEEKGITNVKELWTNGEKKEIAA